MLFYCVTLQCVACSAVMFFLIEAHCSFFFPFHVTLIVHLHLTNHNVKVCWQHSASAMHCGSLLGNILLITITKPTYMKQEACAWKSLVLCSSHLWFFFFYVSSGTQLKTILNLPHVGWIVDNKILIILFVFWRNISINRAPHSEIEPSHCDHTHMSIQFEGLSLIPDLTVATLASGVIIKRCSVWTANCCCHMALQLVLNAASTSQLSLPAVRAEFSHLRIFDHTAHSHPEHCWAPKAF